MIKFSKNLRSRLRECVDKLQALADAQNAALRSARADLQAVRADVAALSSVLIFKTEDRADTDALGAGTAFVPTLEDAAGVCGAAANALLLWASVVAGQTHASVVELGMAGLLREDVGGVAAGLTAAELESWVAATVANLGAALEDLMALPQHVAWPTAAKRLERYPCRPSGT